MNYLNLENFLAFVNKSFDENKKQLFQDVNIKPEIKFLLSNKLYESTTKDFFDKLNHNELKKAFAPFNDALNNMTKTLSELKYFEFIEKNSVYYLFLNNGKSASEKVVVSLGTIWPSKNYIDDKMKVSTYEEKDRVLDISPNSEMYRCSYYRHNPVLTKELEKLSSKFNSKDIKTDSVHISFLADYVEHELFNSSNYEIKDLFNMENQNSFRFLMFARREVLNIYEEQSNALQIFRLMNERNINMSNPDKDTLELLSLSCDYNYNKELLKYNNTPDKKSTLRI